MQALKALKDRMTNDERAELAARQARRRAVNQQFTMMSQAIAQHDAQYYLNHGNDEQVEQSSPEPSSPRLR
jgi:hypothetical protein